MGSLLLVFLYLLRIAIRSKQLAHVIKNVEESIRETSKVPGTEEIPARVVVSYAWRLLTPLSQGLLFVVPTLIVLLSVINTLAAHTEFRASSSVLLVVGGLLVALFLGLERYGVATQVGTVSTWLVCILAITLGPKQSLNNAATCALAIFVSTVALAAFAFIPQPWISKPFKRVWQLVMPLWVLVIPVIALVHFDKVSDPPWRPWILPIVCQIFVVLVAIVPADYPREVRNVLKLLSIGAITLGIPLPIMWIYWPLNQGAMGPPALWAQILTTFAAVILCLIGTLFVFENDLSDGIIGILISFIVVVAAPLVVIWLPKHPIGHDIPLYAQLLATLGTVLAALLILNVAFAFAGIWRSVLMLSTSHVLFVGIPGVIIWCYLPYAGRALSRHQSISISLGCSVFACAITLLDPQVREDLRRSIWDSPVLLLGFVALVTFSIMAWLPLVVWLSDWPVMDVIRNNKQAKIHVIWVSAVLWVVLCIACHKIKRWRFC